MPSTISLHRAGDVEVGELGTAAQLAVLAGRRVVLHLGGVALEAQQPVGALDLAGEEQLGEDRLERDALAHHHADEALRHAAQRRRQRLLDRQVEDRLLPRR